jgi:hypothetical protein
MLKKEIYLGSLDDLTLIMMTAMSEKKRVTIRDSLTATTAMFTAFH